MLALSGKVGARFVLANCEIAVVVGRKEGANRKLLIFAPSEIQVLRKELGAASNDDDLALEDYGCLVLSRKAGESIDFWIAGELIGFITLVNNKKSARLGFEFLDYVNIQRESVFTDEYRQAHPTFFTNPIVQQILEEARA